MISVESLSVSFGSVGAIEDVSLAVERGECVGLVGPNGAGKTTLLNTINGLVEPTRGTVTVDGDDVDSLSARELAQRVATVPQETSLSFAFPVREVVAMGRTPYRSRFEQVTDTDREHTERAMARTDVAEFADRTIDEVSGGERQRVILARALCQNTQGLVLDEPTASLDINHQVRTLSLVREFVAEGRAVCCAIHDLSLAARFCDRLVLLADGRVLATGTPETVLTEENVEQAFDTDAVVTHHPITGATDVTAIEIGQERDARVHVLGGGRACARAITALSVAGFDVSAGPLSSTDTALTATEALGVEIVTTEPFAAVAANTIEEATELIRDADAVVTVGGTEAVGVSRALLDVAERVVVIEGDSNDPPEGVEYSHRAAIDDLIAVVESALDTEPRQVGPQAADD